jgi:hypothetical protein
MLVDLYLRQSQRGSQQSRPNDPSPSGMHSPLELEPQGRPQISNRSICSSSNASSTSSDSDSDSETGEPTQAFRAGSEEELQGY